MPKDVALKKRKARATDEPVPLYDNTTRSFLSTRTPAPAITASNVTTRPVRSKLIPALSAPFLGDFNEAMYARPPDLDDDGYDHTGPDHDTSAPAVIQSGLPGIAIKMRSKRYLNSVRFYFSSKQPFPS